MEKWDSTQYLKFGKERTQPAIDLVSRIGDINPRKIIDIGCGPGNSTNVLARRYPGAFILGIDNSPDMIEAAKKDYPQLHFMLCDAGSDLNKLDRDFDIVFSNACIQWVPNHHELIRSMLDLLSPNGILAVQTPMNYDEPIHQIIGRVSTCKKWDAKFPNKRIFYNLSQGEYYDLLSETASDFCMWQTTYFHRMQSHKEILEWYRGTGLRPYFEALSKPDQLEFEKDIYNKICSAYPEQKNEEIIFRFPRFFFIAVK